MYSVCLCVCLCVTGVPGSSAPEELRGAQREPPTKHFSQREIIHSLEMDAPQPQSPQQLTHTGVVRRRSCHRVTEAPPPECPPEVRTAGSAWEASRRPA